ncbi:MAG: hypothetical protein DME93_06580 [Verrucomicrobia bacterium]|nr:MAG: hypothetical protein DME93_06580 [Verrucomicrobiota bacterium]
MSQELFIVGIDTIIDKVVTDIPNTKRAFRAILALRHFPGTMQDWNGGGKRLGNIVIAFDESLALSCLFEIFSGKTARIFLPCKHPWEYRL